MLRFTLACGVGLTLMSATAASAQHACNHEDTLVAHMGHVMWCWDDTPEGRGLLTTALAEGAVAVKYAKQATADPENLEAIRTNLGYVIHALDPTAETDGEGLDYGLILAAEGAAVHLRFALQAETMFSSGGAGDGDDGDLGYGYESGDDTDDALDSALDSAFDELLMHEELAFVVSQAEFAKLSLANASALAAEALALAQAARTMSDPAEAAAAAREVLVLIGAVMDGADADGDGVITEEAGEGGLKLAHRAVTAIIEAEALIPPPTHSD